MNGCVLKVLIPVILSHFRFSLKSCLRKIRWMASN
jgi:hypothetical protein